MARDAVKFPRTKAQIYREHSLTWAFVMERVTGIEPASRAWEALILPLNYTRGAAERNTAGPQRSGEGGWRLDIRQGEPCRALSR